MKKNAKVEFSSKWWTKHKAATLRNKGFGNALKSYESLRKGQDFDKMLAALNKVENERKACLKACNKMIHSDTIAGLERYKTAIVTEREAIEAEQLRHNWSNVVPKQKMGKSVVVWRVDIGPDVRKIVMVEGLERWSCVLKLELDSSVLDALEAAEDYVTPAFMVEDAQAVGKSLTTVVAGLLKNYNKSAEGKSAAEQLKLARQAAKDVDKAAAAAASKLRNIPSIRWKKFVSRHAQYKDYQLKCGSDATLAAMTILTTGVGIALAGPGGVVGIVSLVRNTLAIADLCVKMRASAAKVGAQVENDIETLKKRYLVDLKQARKAKQAASEVGGTSVKILLGTDAPFLATLPKCQSNMKLWDNKVAGVAIGLPKLSKSVMKSMTAVNKVKKDLAKNNDSKTIKKINSDLEKLEKCLDDALAECSDQASQVRKFEQEFDTLKRHLDGLAGANYWAVDKFEKYGLSTVNLMLAGLGQAGIGTGADAGNKGLVKLWEKINTAEATATTVLSEYEAQAG